MAQSSTDNYVTSLLQRIAVSDYPRQQPIGYFSLPPEIRNMIMELVFVPGQVLLDDFKPIKRDHKSFLLQGALHRMIKPVSKRSNKESKSKSVLQPPGFQLLATCRQICAEGYPVFYSSNVFFLPPGPLENTHRSLTNLQPQCRAMIRTVGIVMTLQDLTPAVFEQIKHDMQARYGKAVANTPNLAQATRWSESVEKELACIWKEKLIHVLTHSKKLKFLRLRFDYNEESEDSNAEDMTQTVDFFEEVDDILHWSPEVRSSVWRAKRHVREEVEDIIAMHGLKALNAKVKKGAFKTG